MRNELRKLALRHYRDARENNKTVYVDFIFLVDADRVIASAAEESDTRTQQYSKKVEGGMIYHVSHAFRADRNWDLGEHLDKITKTLFLMCCNAVDMDERAKKTGLLSLPPTARCTRAAKGRTRILTRMLPPTDDDGDYISLEDFYR